MLNWHNTNIYLRSLRLSRLLRLLHCLLLRQQMKIEWKHVYVENARHVRCHSASSLHLPVAIDSCH